MQAVCETAAARALRREKKSDRRKDFPLAARLPAMITIIGRAVRSADAREHISAGATLETLDALAARPCSAQELFEPIA